MKIRLINFGLLTKYMPFRAHVNDAGADVYSPVTRVLNPGSVEKIPLRFGIELPDGMVGFVFPRSSLSAKGITCELPPIDSGYRGEIHAVISNVGHDTYTIKEGDRVGQLVILPVITPDFTFEAFKERGEGAFGSTGK